MKNRHKEEKHAQKHVRQKEINRNGKQTERHDKTTETGVTKANRNSNRKQEQKQNHT